MGGNRDGMCLISLKLRHHLSPITVFIKIEDPQIEKQVGAKLSKTLEIKPNPIQIPHTPASRPIVSKYPDNGRSRKRSEICSPQLLSLPLKFILMIINISFIAVNTTLGREVLGITCLDATVNSPSVGGKQRRWGRTVVSK